MPKRARHSAPSGTFVPFAGTSGSGSRSRSGSRKGGRLRARNALVRVPRGKLAFPQEMSTTIRYVDTIDLVPSSDTATGKAYLANGCYDPQVDLGGHHPRGFNQFKDVYQKFTVKASKISVTFAFEGYHGCSTQDSTGTPTQSVGVPASSGTVVACPSAIGLIHKTTNNANPSATIQEFQEMDRTKWCTIAPVGEPKTISSRMKMSEYFGKDFLVGSDGYTGTATTDPENLVYFIIMAGLNSNEYSTSIKLRCNLCIEYDVTWTEPKQLDKST